jgi:hypothetical protein
LAVIKAEHADRHAAMVAAYQTGESSYQQMKGQGEIVHERAKLRGCQPIGEAITPKSTPIG